MAREHTKQTAYVGTHAQHDHSRHTDTHTQLQPACKVWRVAQEPPCGTQSEVKELVSTPLALPMHCTPAFSCALRGRFPDIQC